MGQTWRRCTSLVPTSSGPDKVMALPRCREGWNTVPGLAAASQQSFSPGKGADSLVNIALCARGGRGPAGHYVFLSPLPS